jgi:hypothetical protein
LVVTARERTCPYPGCEESVRPGAFACRPHWYLLPKRMRDEINRRYRDWMANRADLASLRRAQLDAVRYWKEHP